MKSSRVERIKNHPFFWVLTLLVPALLWGTALASRSSVIGLHCLPPTSGCDPALLMPMDRFAFGNVDSLSDWYSYLAQNLSVALAFTVPLFWSLFFGLKSNILKDLILCAKILLWNGFFTELSHLASQRARPFVYLNPLEQGLDAAHYTSFYSGHTSAVAAANIATLMILWHRKAPRGVLLTYLAVTEVLIFCTGYFRIFAGRHFLSDVLTGAVAGTIVAVVLATRSFSSQKLTT